MGTEIERKFLLRDDSWRKEVTKSTVFQQRYLPFAGPSSGSGRVRIAGDKAFLTLKSPVKGFSRSEFEYEIPVPDAEEVIRQICTGASIQKTRHLVPYEGFLWEIDEFAGENAGLIVAEIELDSEDRAFPLPPWIGEEVTGDPRYFNSVLAEHPFSTWKEQKFQSSCGIS